MAPVARSNRVSKAPWLPAKKDIRVLRVRRNITALASSHGIERRKHSGANQAAAPSTGLTLNADRRVVLLSPAHLIRDVFRGCNVVELGSRKLLSGPRLATIQRNRAAAIIAADHALVICWVDPKIVMIAVRPFESPSSSCRQWWISGMPRSSRRSCLFLSDRRQSREIEGSLQARRSSLTSVHDSPRVVRLEKSAVRRLDHRVNTLRVNRRNGNTNLPDDALGQAIVARDLLPVSPPSTDLKSPLPGPPSFSIQGVRYTSHSAANSTLRVAGIHSEFDRARMVITEKNAFPVLAAIGMNGTRRARCWARTDDPAPQHTPGSGREDRRESLRWLECRRQPDLTQVLPASVDLYTPSPCMMLPRSSVSPVPM